jgi:hypothetical protein
MEGFLGGAWFSGAAATRTGGFQAVNGVVNAIKGGALQKIVLPIFACRNAAVCQKRYIFTFYTGQGA